MNIPEKGDLVWINFNPQSGHEQAGHRPALVISPRAYHEKSSLALVCPITSNIQAWPWKVMLPSGLPAAGAVLTDQLRSIDRESRHLKIIGQVDNDVMQEVMAKLAALLLG